MFLAPGEKIVIHLKKFSALEERYVTNLTKFFDTVRQSCN